MKISNENLIEISNENNVPTNWGMFSTAGNKRISNLATKFMKMVTIKNYDELIPDANKFLIAYRAMDQKKSYSEASDTEVRECIWNWFEKVCDENGINANEIWDSEDSQQ